MRALTRSTLLSTAALLLAAAAAQAAPEVVKGPGYLPECFKP